MAQQSGYPQEYASGQYGDASQSAPQSEASAAQPAQGKKKGRQYAGQAYDFGHGANTQQPSLGGGPGPTGYDSYGQPPAQAYQQPGYGQEYPAQPAADPGYGQQPPAVGGYQPPDAGYQGGGGVGGITQGMGQMGISGSPQPPPQAQGGMRPHLNQLYPTDMMSQPFQVSELDQPPPAIVLPANVSNHPMCTDLSY